jgi:hypothetical protein
MTLTFDKVKEFLNKNADDILLMSTEGNGACKRITSAVYLYSRLKSKYSETLVTEATEAFIKEQQAEGNHTDIKV